MPVPHHAPVVAAPTLTSAVVALRRQGVRLSQARRHLLEALYATAAPRTAEQLAAAGAGDLGTVYRNLAALEAAGVVRHCHTAQGAARWAPAGAVREAAECEWCGARQELDERLVERVRAALRQAAGFEVHLDHAPLPGLCARCAARSGRMQGTCSSSSTSTARCC